MIRWVHNITKIYLLATWLVFILLAQYFISSASSPCRTHSDVFRLRCGSVSYFLLPVTHNTLNIQILKCSCRATFQVSFSRLFWHKCQFSNLPSASDVCACVPEDWTSGSAKLWLRLHQQRVLLDQLNQMTRLQWHATPRWHHRHYHHLSIYSRLTFLTTSRPPVIHLASTAGITPHDGKRLRLLTVAGDVTSLLRSHWPSARPADHISGPLNPELYSRVYRWFLRKAC